MFNEMVTMRYFALTSMLVVQFSVAASCGNAAQADETNVPANLELKNKQESVSGRYARFERVLSQMADILGYDDPERAELLRRAISESKEKSISGTLDAIAKDLGKSSFGDALEKQRTVSSDLQSLLKLLQSEDRMSAVERERERIANLLKDINNVKAKQRAARAKTQNSNAPSNAAPDQQQTLNDTEDILNDIKQHDGDSDPSAEAKEGAEGSQQSSNSKSGEKKSKGENKSGESGKPSGSEGEMGEEKSGEPGNGDPKSGDKKSDDSKKPGDEKDPGGEKDKDGSRSEDGKEAKGGESSESKDSESKKSDGKSSEESKGQSGDKSSKSESQSQPPDSSPQSSGKSPEQQEDPPEQTAGREQLQKAQNLMMEALEQLKQQEREKAVDKQDKAISELQAAAAELEKMLQQLREEEKEMILATLEARFQRLLALQTQIYDSTLDLAATPRDQWLDITVGECKQLSQQQTETTQECSYTTSLLREDGTSVSILVAVEDIETDMGTIADRLQQTKVGALTQSMETDVIDALKELIEATQREMAEMKNKENKPPQPQQGGDQQKPALVQLMQEIKVLRSLQVRVNKRTKQVSQLFLEADSSDVADLQAQVTELASRQERLKDSAAELAKQMEEQR